MQHITLLYIVVHYKYIVVLLSTNKILIIIIYQVHVYVLKCSDVYPCP